MPYFTTPALTIKDLPADAAHKGGTRRGYRWIFMHATGGTDSRAWLSTTSNPPVSCHRLITKTGAIYKIVPDHEVAWTQGPADIGPIPENGQNANEWALSIELENLNDGRDPYPLEQVAAAVLQVREWYGLYGAIPIVAHAWMQTNKHDPAGFNWPAFYDRLFARLGEVL